MMSRREGEWWITTPLYCGSIEDVLKATLCPHENYSPIQVPKDELMKEGVTEAVLEKCDNCCARRLRYKSDIEHQEVKS
jgi:hypothetical protein